MLQLHKYYYVTCIVFLNNSNGNVLHCGGDGWDISTTKKDVLFKISCQNNNLKQVYTNFIYRKIHKKAKRQSLRKWIYPLEKRYHTDFKALIITFSLQNTQVLS